MNTRQWTRVLAIEGYSRGFGFAVIEDGARLIDYGLVQLRPWSADKAKGKLTTLLAYIQPDVVGIRDECGPTTGKRTLWTVKEIEKLAAANRLPLRRIRRCELDAAFPPVATHQNIATEIGKTHPELAGRFRATRRPWMSEDARVRVAIAIALALVVFARQQAIDHPGETITLSCRQKYRHR